MPMATPLIASKREPTFRIIRGPISMPSFAKIGAKMKAAKLVIPNTKPYWDGLAPRFAASDG